MQKTCVKGEKGEKTSFFPPWKLKLANVVLKQSCIFQTFKYSRAILYFLQFSVLSPTKNCFPIRTIKCTFPIFSKFLRHINSKSKKRRKEKDKHHEFPICTNLINDLPFHFFHCVRDAILNFPFFPPTEEISGKSWVVSPLVIFLHKKIPRRRLPAKTKSQTNISIFLYQL